MRPRFIHAAGFHMDTPFMGMRRADSRLAATLRDTGLDNLVLAPLEHCLAFQQHPLSSITSLHGMSTAGTA